MLDSFRAEADAARGRPRARPHDVRAAYGLESPPVEEDAALDLRAHRAVTELVAELEGWLELGGALSREELYGALDRAL